MIPCILYILAWHTSLSTYLTSLACYFFIMPLLFMFTLHTSSLIILMQSDFLKQTNVENILYPLYIVSFVISLLLNIFLLIHSWFIIQSLIKASPLSNSSCSCKASHLYATNPYSSTYVSFAICQIYLLSYESMISHIREAISSTLIALLSFDWTRLFL